MKSFRLLPASEGPRREFKITLGLRAGYGPAGRTYDLEEAVRTAHRWMTERAARGEPFLSGMFTRGEVVYADPEDGPQAIASGSPPSPARFFRNTLAILMTAPCASFSTNWLARWAGRSNKRKYTSLTVIGSGRSPPSFNSIGKRPPNFALFRRTPMKIVRFASASDGGSQFVELDMPIDNASTDAFGNTVRRSAILPAQSTMVTEMPEGFYQDWHPASRRQLLIVLSGTLEVETSDGKKHRCGSGEVFLADDVGGRGHRTRTIGGPARVFFVHLPPEADVGG